MIFLSKWREDGSSKQDDSCPSNVWFANQVYRTFSKYLSYKSLIVRQTVSNACASLALLNIINNISSIDLGTHLQHFKQFTKDLTPALRGNAVANFEFVQQIHNSFARYLKPPTTDRLALALHNLILKISVFPRREKLTCGRRMDMLNADLQLKNDFALNPNSSLEPSNSVDSRANFHFVAFVPAHGKVWKLDGLQRQPENLGIKRAPSYES